MEHRHITSGSNQSSKINPIKKPMVDQFEIRNIGRGGQKGGKARVEKFIKEQRAEIAKKNR